MNTNIPIKETINIIMLQLQQLQEDTDYIQQFINSLNTVLQQNYFVYNKEFYLHLEGLPMDSPISPIFLEIFLQYLESQHIEKIKQFNIIYYYRYVDDIFIIYDNPLDIGDNILNKFNTLHKNIVFTIETQFNNKLNFFDFCIRKINKNHKFNLKKNTAYRKITTSKLSINYNSFHPNSHKWANFHFLLNRLNNIPLSKSNYNKEFSNILSIAQFSKYPISEIYALNNKIKAKIKNKKLTKLHNTNNKKSMGNYRVLQEHF